MFVKCRELPDTRGYKQQSWASMLVHEMPMMIGVIRNACLESQTQAQVAFVESYFTHFAECDKALLVIDFI